MQVWLSCVHLVVAYLKLVAIPCISHKSAQTSIYQNPTNPVISCTLTDYLPVIHPTHHLTSPNPFPLLCYSSS